MIEPKTDSRPGYATHASTVRFHWDGQTRLGLVRNGVIRHVEPAINQDDTLCRTDARDQYDMPESLQKAASSHPALFEELKHLTYPGFAPSPIALRPDHVLRALYKGRWTLMAIGNGVILNACYQDVGTVLNDQDIDELQSAYDACPRAFLKIPLTHEQLVIKRAADAAPCPSTPLPPIIALYADTLCLAADDLNHKTSYGIHEVQSELPVRFRIIKTESVTYEAACEQFPRFNKI